MNNPTQSAERHATASDKFRHRKRVLKHLEQQEMLELLRRGERIINELAKLGRCPIILRVFALDLRDAIAKATGD